MRAVLVPGVLALLPEYAGAQDPVCELRAACRAAVAWAAEDGPVAVLGSAQGRRVAESLLGEGGLDTPSLVPRDGYSTTEAGSGSLVPRDGYSTTEAGSGSFVPRDGYSTTEAGSGSFVPRDGYSTTEAGAGLLVVGNGSAKRRDTSPGYVDERAIGFDEDLGARLRSGELAGIDAALARELWADTEAIAELGGVLPPGVAGTVDYEDDPYGVQYWVVRWEW
ncbi:MAG TPA: hypothetical protein VFT70_19100 [Nocardioides sp.]|nr:hypothetical protein [Nocardioides sp.]